MSTRSALLILIASLFVGSTAHSLEQSIDSKPELEEVIVQAQKRDQDIQDVPVAVSVMDRTAIEESGILTLQGLTDINSSVSFDTAQSFQNASLKIRGIGTVGNSRTFEGSVGVFIDGVYRSRSGMALMDLLDVERIEVLRGPQGTLFGKNTVAGAISVYSQKPIIGENKGQLDLRLGNFSEIYAFGAWNASLGESSALRVAASVNKRDGLITSPDTGEGYDEIDRYAIKAQWAFEPTEDLSILLIADTAKSDANCCWSSPQVVNGPLTPLVQTYSALNGLSFINAPEAEDNRLSSLNTSPREVVEDSGLAATVNWDTVQFSLRSITAWRSWDNEQIQGDADFVAANLLVLDEPASVDWFSQEFNVTFETGNASWLLGLYYATEDFDSTRTVFTSPDTDNYLNTLVSTGFGAVACLPPVVALDCSFPAGINALLDNGPLSREYYSQKADNWAVFAHSTIDLTDNLQLLLGGRYNIENKEGGVDVQYWYDSAIVRAVLESLGVPDDGTPRNGLDLIGTMYSPSFSRDTEDKEFTGTIGLQFNFSESMMAYARYDRGYKAGGINLFREAVETGTTTYAPEYTDSIEAGLKSRWWEGRALTNVTLFYSELSDLQINFFDGLNFRTENTGEASTKGLELESQFQLSDRWGLRLDVTWLDASFGQLDPPELFYLENRDTPRAPNWSGVFVANWNQPLRRGRALFARGLVSYTGSHYVGADVVTESKAPSYSLVDLSLGIRDGGGRWEVLAWCRNCTDESYRTILFNSTFQSGSENAFLNAPRQYGVTFRSWF